VNIPSEEQFALMARRLDEKKPSPRRRQFLKDMGFSLILASITGGLLSMAVGTLGTQTGLINGDRIMGLLFTGFAFPLFLIALFIFTRESRKERSEYEKEFQRVKEQNPSFSSFYEAWKQKNR
jgi:hydrogenase-4 membrane subunit HyfE